MSCSVEYTTVLSRIVHSICTDAYIQPVYSVTYITPLLFSMFPVDEEKWDMFLRGYMRHWSSRLLQWIIYQDKHPIHILRYEDLKQDTVGEIEKTLDFLDVSYDPETVRKKLNLDYTDFKRPHDRNEYEHYSVEQKEFVKSVLLDVNVAARRAKKARLLRLDDYIPAF